MAEEMPSTSSGSRRSSPGPSSPQDSSSGLSRERVRAIVHTMYATGEEPKVALQKITRAYGEVISRSQLYCLYAQYRAGRNDIGDRPRSGRPPVHQLDASFLIAQIQQAPQLTLVELAERVGVSTTTIMRRLRELNFRRNRASGYEYILTIERLEARVESCVELLLRNEDDPSFLQRIITCDDLWLIYEGHNPLRMLCPNSGPPMLLQDGATLHTSDVAQERYEERGIEVLTHPPRSPDLSPTDFYLFSQYRRYRRTQIHMRDQGVDDICDHFMRYIRGQPRSFYSRGILEELPARWEACISLEGAPIPLD
ncbi:histone-lysine N-methyltransferase SETMAR-like [Lasioglossum baleicum]|uniref:histone-lysine N-methyltransferase SETMAR-like n=1 Tax=Lasioglossum baleicum TaxID=434251 RepID=UPI003FCD5225